MEKTRLEQIIEIIKDSFEAGREFQIGVYSEYHGGYENEKPDRSDWINSIKTRLAKLEQEKPESVKSTEEIMGLISKIRVDRANAEYIAKTGTINGGLLADLRHIIVEEYRNQPLPEINNNTNFEENFMEWMENQPDQTMVSVVIIRLWKAFKSQLKNKYENNNTL